MPFFELHPFHGRAAGLAYMAELAHDSGQSVYALFKDYPHPRPEENDRRRPSGFIALTPEGMAGTSQDRPAAEVAAASVLPCSSAFVLRSDI
jgi:hypothetical protein